MTQQRFGVTLQSGATEAVIIHIRKRSIIVKALEEFGPHWQTPMVFRSLGDLAV